MKHGEDFVTDSSMITSYLQRKYSQQMALFTPDDPKLCAPLMLSSAGSVAELLPSHSNTCPAVFLAFNQALVRQNEWFSCPCLVWRCFMNMLATLIMGTTSAILVAVCYTADACPACM